MKKLLVFYLLFPLFVFSQQTDIEGIYILDKKGIQCPNTSYILLLRNDSTYFEFGSSMQEWYSSGRYYCESDKVYLNSYFNKSGNTGWDIVKRFADDSIYTIYINLDYSYESDRSYRIFMYLDTNRIDIILKNDTTFSLLSKPDSIRISKCYECFTPNPKNEFSYSKCILSSYKITSESGIEIIIHNSLSVNYETRENTAFNISRKNDYFIKRIKEKRLKRILKRRDKVGIINLINQWKTL